MFSKNKGPTRSLKQHLSITAAAASLLVGSHLIWAGLTASCPSANADTVPRVEQLKAYGVVQSGNLCTKRIEQIKPGDLVLARDPETGEAAAKLVLRTVSRVSHHIRVLRIADDGGDEQELRTTDNHPFWVVGVGWKPAGELTTGESTLDRTGHPCQIVASKLESHPEGIEVFNFEVKDWHNYFVSEEQPQRPIWVHNDVKCLSAFGSKDGPRAPRQNKDIDVDPDGLVHPTSQNGWPKGASLTTDPNGSGLTGYFHDIPADAPLPAGTMITPDGADVGGPHARGHHTFWPTEPMTYEEFVEKFLSLPWEPGGYIPKRK